MALTARQRNALPASAFALRKARKYPMPTKAQARRAGISERQRMGLHRNARSRAAQSKTASSLPHIRSVSRRNGGGRIGRGRR
jgi:hypothetical protein